MLFKPAKRFAKMHRHFAAPQRLYPYQIKLQPSTICHYSLLPAWWKQRAWWRWVVLILVLCMWSFAWGKGGSPQMRWILPIQVLTEVLVADPNGRSLSKSWRECFAVGIVGLRSGAIVLVHNSSSKSWLHLHHFSIWTVQIIRTAFLGFRRPQRVNTVAAMSYKKGALWEIQMICKSQRMSALRSTRHWNTQLCMTMIDFVIVCDAWHAWYPSAHVPLSGNARLCHCLNSGTCSWWGTRAVRSFPNV